MSKRRVYDEIGRDYCRLAERLFRQAPPVGIASGYFPALKAQRLQVIEALRTE